MPSPSSPFGFERKGLPTPLLVILVEGKFRFSTHYRTLADVEPDAVADFLRGWCEQQEREHLERLADAERALRRAEGLSLESLSTFNNLDLGIDL